MSSNAGLSYVFPWFSNIALVLHQFFILIDSGSWQRLFPSFAQYHLKWATLQFKQLYYLIRNWQPFFFTGRLCRPFRSAALHRIRLVTMTYYYSETNKGSKGWVNQWELLVLAKSIEIIISHQKKILSQTCQWLVAAQKLRSVYSFLTLKLSHHHNSDGTRSLTLPAAG